MTLCIGQLHPITIYRTGFWMFIVLVLSVIRYSFYYFLNRILFYPNFHHDSFDYYWDFTAIIYFLNYTFRLSVTKYFSFCKCATPCLFLPLDILLEYWIEKVTFGFLYVMFAFLTRISYKGVPGFANDCPCSVWCHGLTTCLLYVGPLFGNLV